VHGSLLGLVVGETCRRIDVMFSDKYKFCEYREKKSEIEMGKKRIWKDKKKETFFAVIFKKDKQE